MNAQIPTNNAGLQQTRSNKYATLKALIFNRAQCHMHTTDAAMPMIVGALLIILLIGMVLRRFNQPHVVGYLIAGVVLGLVLGMVTNHETLSR